MEKKRFQIEKLEERIAPCPTTSVILGGGSSRVEFVGDTTLTTPGNNVTMPAASVTGLCNAGHAPPSP